MSLEIVNLTPHVINLVANGQNFAIAPFDPQSPARAEETVTPNGEMDINIDGVVVTVPITKSVYGAPIGLPAPEAGRVFIVSALTAAAMRSRPDYAARLGVDVFGIGSSVRNSDNKIIGFASLADMSS